MCSQAKMLKLLYTTTKNVFKYKFNIIFIISSNSLQQNYNKIILITSCSYNLFTVFSFFVIKSKNIEELKNKFLSYLSTFIKKNNVYINV